MNNDSMEEAFVHRLQALGRALLICFFVSVAGEAAAYLSYYLFFRYAPGLVTRLFLTDWTIASAVWLAFIVAWKLVTWMLFVGWLACRIWSSGLRKKMR